MKKYVPKFDVGVVLSRQPQLAQTAAAEARLLDYILMAEKREVRSRLDEIVVILERRYWKCKETKTASAGFLKELARRMFAEDRLDAYFETHRVFLSMNVSQREMLLYRGHHPNPNVHLACARNWFLNEFYRVAGESVEHAAKFALRLLAMFAEFSQQLFRQAGSQASLSPPVETTAGNKTRWTPGTQVYLIVWGSAECPPHTDAPMRAWLDRLLGALDSSESLNEIVGSVFDLLCLLTPDNYMVVKSVAAGQEMTTCMVSIMKTLGGAAEITAGDILERPTAYLVLPEARYRDFTRFSERRRERAAADLKSGEVVLNWFDRSKEALSAESGRWKSEILDQPKRALRMHGTDHIDIDVAPLRNAGVRGVIFHPEGCVFPDVRVEVVIRKETPHLMLVPGYVRNFSLEIHEDSLENVTHRDLDQLRRLLELVILDMMHRVIVEGREFRPSQGKDGEIQSADRRIPVRPYVRALAEGQRMSPEAKRLADEAGFPVKPGYTFVPAHYRGGHLVYDLPTGPIGVYSDQDLLERGAVS